jgi:hypothetical protein
LTLANCRGAVGGKREFEKRRIEMSYVRPDFLVTVLLSLSLVVITRPAAALTGDLCQGASEVDSQKVVRNYTSHQLKVLQDAKVVCPIVKTTSGPNIYSNDAITQVKIAFANQNTHPAECSLSIYSVDPYSPNTTTGNLVKRLYGSTASRYLTIDVAQANRIRGYWYGEGGAHAWYYPQIECELEAGTIIKYVGYLEEGVDQPGMRIASAAYCSGYRDAYRTFMTPTNGADTYGWGYVQAANSNVHPYPGESGFDMWCPSLPGAGKAIEIAVGQAINPDIGMQCGTTHMFEPNQTLSVTWMNGKELWPRVLTFNDQPFPAMLRCIMTGPTEQGGDAKIYSYRTANFNTQF